MPYLTVQTTSFMVRPLCNEKSRFQLPPPEPPQQYSFMDAQDVYKRQMHHGIALLLCSHGHAGGAVHVGGSQIQNLRKRRSGLLRKIIGFMHSLAGLPHKGHTGMNGFLNAGDFCTYGLSSGDRFFCQLSHLIGNHGKTASGLTCPGCFNGGVQGQQVGLVSNIGNNTCLLYTSRCV